ncbi:MAG: RagB/SusD family nutrient uptake outer membrane protein [Bacteroidales bacterium]|nr:RagB/SusD family nutrient uptake outer membrane protein [Bacteroidales bacterium]
MKRYWYSLLIVFAFISCNENKFLEEQTFGLISPADYFKTDEDLEKTVTALYPYTNQLYRETSTISGVMGGDDVTSWPTKNLWLEADVFATSDENSHYANVWGVCYRMIKQGNTIVELIDNFTEPADDPERLQGQKDLALGQAYFIRALAYFNLVRLWGEVPLVTAIDVNFDLEPAPSEVIFNFIVEDLKKAEVLLPVNFKRAKYATDTEKGTYYARPTSGSAKSLLASVYLTMAGYPVNDASYYALAAEKAKEVIDNEAKYGYELLPIDQLWKYANNLNNETVFGCYYNLAIGDSHNYTMMAPLAHRPGDFGGWDDLFAELTFFKEFPEGPRKDETFFTEGRLHPEDPLITWENFQLKRPYYKKWLDVPGYDQNNLSENVGWKSDRTSMVIRYAEVLLTYAEAQAMSGGPNADAYEAINRVRRRAGLDDLQSGLSAEAFAHAVVDERKWEFAGAEPNARWFDMLRTQTIESATAKRDPNEYNLAQDPTEANYYLPIPLGDALLNNNLINK